MKVLVAYASRHGSTTAIASVIAATLRDAGLEVDCLHVDKAGELAAYDAFVLGSAVYANHWLPEARRFVVRHRRTLANRPSWMFSSGPLDDSALTTTIPAPRSIAALARSIGCGEHVTFGGRLARNASGVIASRLAKTHSGDFRDWSQIRHWAQRVGGEIRTSAVSHAPSEPPARWPLVALCLIVAATALIGGLALVVSPSGALLHAPLALLAHTPFTTFEIPGLLLAGVIGGLHVVAALEVAHDLPRANTYAGLAGVALGTFLCVEALLFRSINALQIAMFAIALAIVFEAVRRWRSDCSFAST